MVGTRYCEYAPCDSLRKHVRAFFTFTSVAEALPARRVLRETVFGANETYWPALLADGHLSLVFAFGIGHYVDGLWNADARHAGYAIGTMSSAHASGNGERVDTVGVYFRAAGARLLTRAPAAELADRVVGIEDLWGSAGGALEHRLAETPADQRIDVLEAELLRRETAGGSLHIAGMATLVLEKQGQISVEELASAAGVSRQHLARAFAEQVGVSPKLYARLARFQAALACARRGASNWAQTAADLGYSDQSHLIADFREFSGSSPAAFARERSFHPFASLG